MSTKLGDRSYAEHNALKVLSQVPEGRNNLNVWRQCNPRAGTREGEICEPLLQRVGEAATIGHCSERLGEGSMLNIPP